MRANRITRIHALIQRIVATAGIEASKLETDEVKFALKPATAYVINRHAAHLPIRKSGGTLFHGRRATWSLNSEAGYISIVAN